MIYRFQSKAAGDVVMLGPAAESVLNAMGIAPAAQGIIEPRAMSAAIGAVEAAIERSESLPSTERAADIEGPAPGADLEPVSLRQRAWPLMEMMRQALLSDEPIVWGV